MADLAMDLENPSLREAGPYKGTWFLWALKAFCTPQALPPRTPSGGWVDRKIDEKFCLTLNSDSLQTQLPNDRGRPGTGSHNSCPDSGEYHLEDIHQYMGLLWMNACMTAHPTLPGGGKRHWEIMEALPPRP